MIMPFIFFMFIYLLFGLAFNGFMFIVVGLIFGNRAYPDVDEQIGSVLIWPICLSVCVFLIPVDIFFKLKTQIAKHKRDNP